MFANSENFQSSENKTRIQTKEFIHFTRLNPTYQKQY